MKTVIEMALEAFDTPETEPAFRNGFWAVTHCELERFADLVRADARALAAPVQEPVAWVDSVMEQAQVFASAWSLVGSRFDSGSGLEDAEQAKAELRAMLTTPPTAQRQWVGLTDEERDDLLDNYITAEGRARAIEAKLKEKNT